MGQTVGRMPETWEGLLEEKDRVLHWSSEVLARVQDNVTNEDTFLIDYDDDKVDAKIDTWIKTNRTRVNETLNKYPNASDQLKNVVNSGIGKLVEEIRAKTKKDYQNAYNDIKKFNKKVDQLGSDERKIHAEIQNLEAECAGNTHQFRKKFGPLRLKVFDNLRTGEKMIFQDKRLKNDFTKKVYDIDHKYSAECVKRIDKLLKDFEKDAAKEGTTE
ncbi:PREDICTED: uncharacterized protein LOC108776557 isoform X1 [Cyphomyrmex costatus]|uniref:uncharacterized protein LOC108776557 isoform X1 n=2 Tax=Cyphomyrmex costatus TaxID=456900 RepID=UPI0008523869|nr:PREDICTED: uncharacterized protein LOC108776557 isoform X1 [Cyphomyrmex costatus]XP_018398713.1 PREDICTED: uncharacterized protein LOC108776557 isoform X1 [Cyphomyrmex costatus]